MAIPADDPRLNEVRVDPRLRRFQPYERDDEGRIVFGEGADPADFLFLEPTRQQYDENALEEALDTSISELANGAQSRDVNTTTIG